MDIFSFLTDFCCYFLVEMANKDTQIRQISDRRRFTHHLSDSLLTGALGVEKMRF